MGKRSFRFVLTCPNGQDRITVITYSGEGQMVDNQRKASMQRDHYAAIRMAKIIEQGA